MPFFNRQHSKVSTLESLLQFISKKGQFDLVVLADQTGLVVSSFTNKNYTPKYYAALSSAIYSSASRYANDLFMGHLNFVIVNSEYGEFILLPIEIEQYHKDFILSALISNDSLSAIRSKERTLYEELLQLFNDFSCGAGFKIKRNRRKSTYSVNSSVDRLHELATNIKSLFSK